MRVKMLLALGSSVDNLVYCQIVSEEEDTMRQFVIGAVILLVLIPVALIAADDRLTFLAVDFVTSRDSIRVLGNITFTEADTSSSFELLLNLKAAVYAMYFLSEEDSITAHFERTGGDTIVVTRSSAPGFVRARVLSFDLAFPIDRNDDSLIMLDRGNRWYPVVPHGLTYVVMQVFAEADDEVLQHG